MSVRRAVPGWLLSFTLASTSLVHAITVNVPADYATIQSAIDDPAVTVIQVSPGHYPENLRVHRQVTLEAAPSSAPFTFASYPSAQSLTVETTRFTCTGMRFRGPAVQPGLPIEVLFTTCRFDSGYVMQFVGGGEIRLRGCLVFGPCRVNGNPAEVSGCVFIGGGLAAGSEGGLTVVDNHIQGPAAVGLSIATGGASGLVGRNVIARADVGIEFQVNGFLNPNLSENEVRDCDGPGIRVVQSGWNGGYPDISGNRVLRCGGHGIEATGGFEPSFTANRIDSVGGTGMLIETGGLRLANGNDVRHTGGPGIDVRSLEFVGDVHDNTVLAAGGAGIRVTKGRVTGNVVGRCGSHGIHVEGGSSFFPPLVRANTLFRNLGSGIAVQLLTADSVDHNIGYLNQRYGLEVLGGVAPTLGCNDWYGNWSGAAFGVPAAPTDLALEPRFCNWPADDVSLSADSPLLAPVNGCGRIGALPMGCAAPSPVGVGPLGTEDRAGGLAVTPSPSRGWIEFRWRPLDASSRLEVFDAAGARRWSHSVTHGEAGTVWDGVDDTGAALPPGIYFAKLAHGRGEFRARVVLTR